MSEPVTLTEPTKTDIQYMARQRVEQNGSRLKRGFGILVVLSVLAGVLAIWGVITSTALLEQGLKNTSQLLAELGRIYDDTASINLDLQNLRRQIEHVQTVPFWYQPSLLFLVVLLTVLHTWVLWVGRRTVDVLTRQTLVPNQQDADRLTRQYRLVRPWIVFSQWLPVVLFVVQILFGVFLWWQVVGMFSNTTLETNTLNVEGQNMMFITIFIENIVLSGGSALIHWFIWNAGILWFDDIHKRCTIHHTLTLKKRSQLFTNWLIVVIIYFSWQLFAILILGIVLVALPSFSEQLQAQSEIVIELSLLYSILRWSGAIFLCLTLLYSLVLGMIFWLRSFAKHTAVLLDSDPDQQKVRPKDPWGGPEVVVVEQ